jgi:hypothetical protein
MGRLANYHLPRKRQDLIRLYSGGLTSNEWSAAKKRYLLYLLLRPALGWLRRSLISSGLEPDEAESEIFILVSKILSSYDASRSCFLYHVENYIPWCSFSLLKKAAKEEAKITATNEEVYEMGGEVYLTIPNVLFEDRWLLRDLSQHEKNLILRVLMEDRPSRKALANSCQVGESTIDRDLRILAGKLKGRLLQW